MCNLYHVISILRVVSNAQRAGIWKSFSSPTITIATVYSLNCSLKLGNDESNNSQTHVN